MWRSRGIFLRRGRCCMGPVDVLTRERESAPVSPDVAPIAPERAAVTPVTPVTPEPVAMAAATPAPITPQAPVYARVTPIQGSRQIPVRDVWFLLISLATPLVGGLAFTLMDWAGVFTSVDQLLYVVILAAVGVAVGGVCGYLLRSWWSIAVAPAMFLLGILLVDAVVVVGGGDIAKILAYEVSMLAWYLAPPALGAVIGGLLPGGALRKLNASMKGNAPA